MTNDHHEPSTGRSLRVLVVNAGSSSLKLRLLDGKDLVEHVDLAPLDHDTAVETLATALAGWPKPDVVGHRIVHGGTGFVTPVRVDAAVRRELEALTSLAPLHQPHALVALDAVTHVFTDVAPVACFDTAFHATLAPEVSTYPVPRAWREDLSIRRFGFHGLSHAYASRRAATMLGRSPADLRIVTCHLGSGASLAAVAGGQSIDTTMGFTPLDGLVMSTRPGAIDPGIILWLQENGVSTERIAHALAHESGLAAFGGSGDMREVEARAGHHHPDALLALAVHNHRLVSLIAAMTASLGGLDALVFTGGIGENSPGVRARAAAKLAFLGVQIAPARNEAGAGERDISAQGCAVRTLIVSAREDLEIVRLVSSFADTSAGTGQM